MRINQAVVVIAGEDPCFGMEGNVVRVSERDGERIVHMRLSRRATDAGGGGLIEVPYDDVCGKRDPVAREARARLMFGHLTVRRVFTIPDPFSMKRVCDWGACVNLAARRGFVHEHGTIVTEYDLCMRHAQEYHGTSVIAFPVKPYATMSTDVT